MSTNPGLLRNFEASEKKLAHEAVQCGLDGLHWQQKEWCKPIHKTVVRECLGAGSDINSDMLPEPGQRVEIIELVGGIFDWSFFSSPTL